MSRAERKSFEIAESKEKVFIRDRYRCRICGESIYTYGTPQLAHRIPQSKIKQYGKRVIHHPENLLSCCSLKCNSKADIGGRPEEVQELVEYIWCCLMEEDGMGI